MIRLLMVGLVVFGFRSCEPAGADEAAVYPRTEAFLLVGSSFAPKTVQTSNFQGRSTKTTTSDKGAFQFGVDIGYNFTEKFAATLMADSLTYKYANGGGDDSLYFFGIAPKYRHPFRDFVFWGQVGAGAAVNKVGETAGAGPTSVIILNDSSDVGLALTARAGADYHLNSNIGFRLSLAFTRAEFSYGYNARAIPGGANLGDGVLELDRQWFTAYAGFTGGF